MFFCLHKYTDITFIFPNLFSCWAKLVLNLISIRVFLNVILQMPNNIRTAELRVKVEWKKQNPRTIKSEGLSVKHHTNLLHIVHECSREPIHENHEPHYNYCTDNTFPKLFSVILVNLFECIDNIFHVLLFFVDTNIRTILLYFQIYFCRITCFFPEGNPDSKSWT